MISSELANSELTMKVAEIELAEKEKMKDNVDLICAHDINVFINRQLIYNYPEQVSWSILAPDRWRVKS